MIYLPYAICIFVPLALTFAGHWFPWPIVIGRALRRLEAYTIGVLIILAPPTVAILAAHDLIGSVQALALVWVSCLSAGFATVAAWGIDALVAYIHSLKDQVDRADFSKRP